MASKPMFLFSLRSDIGDPFVRIAIRILFDRLWMINSMDGGKRLSSKRDL